MSTKILINLIIFNFKHIYILTSISIYWIFLIMSDEIVKYRIERILDRK